MSGSCGACVEGNLYLFGGHHARGNTNLVRLFPQRQQHVPHSWKIFTTGNFFSVGLKARCMLKSYLCVEDQQRTLRLQFSNMVERHDRSCLVGMQEVMILWMCWNFMHTRDEKV